MYCQRRLVHFWLEVAITKLSILNKTPSVYVMTFICHGYKIKTKIKY